MKPPDAEPGELTPSGHPERRKKKYLSVEQFEAWRRRARNRLVVAWLLLAGVSSFAAWVGYEAGRDTDLRSCTSGAEFRVTVAAGFDDLRRLAIGVQPGTKPDSDELDFLQATQPAVDRLLTQAAGSPIHPGGDGEVTQQVIDNTLAMAHERCKERVSGRPPS